MKTEMFLSTTPGIGGASVIHSLPKTPDDAAAIFLLDTPPNTPVGTPGSDIFSDESAKNRKCSQFSDDEPSDVHKDKAENSSGTFGDVQRTSPIDIKFPRGRERKKCRHRKKRPSSSYSDDFSDMYTLTQDLLGKGSFGCVSTCVLKTTGEEFAVKLIEKGSGTRRHKVFCEIENNHFCKGHENIVTLLHFFEESDRFCLIFEKVYGGPLSNHIQKTGSFDENLASMVTKDISKALAFLHSKGIAHRDLKPDNILCFSENQVCPVKICDLGLSSTAELGIGERSLCSPPELFSPVGTPEFMAPEVVKCFTGEDVAYDKRCDLWSLGVILYMMLCGYPPFYGCCGDPGCSFEKPSSCFDCKSLLYENIKDVVYDFPEKESTLSKDVKYLIRHLLVKNPRERISAEMVLKHSWVACGGPTAFFPHHRGIAVPKN